MFPCRIFNLKLQRDTSTFSPDLVIDTPDGVLKDYDTSHIYTGKLVGKSHVFPQFISCCFIMLMFNESEIYFVSVLS